MSPAVPKLPVTPGSSPPAVGLGLWKIDRADTAGMVEEAIRVGYRHLDAACDYGNEVEAGAGIRSIRLKLVRYRSPVGVSRGVELRYSFTP